MRRLKAWRLALLGLVGTFVAQNAYTILLN
jgi:hypothetical protein